MHTATRKSACLTVFRWLTWQAALPFVSYAKSSTGCGRHAPQAPGTTMVHRLVVDGLEQEYLLYLPISYEANRAMPLVLSHGGWGVQAAQDERLSGLSMTAKLEGFLVAYVRGYADNP